MDTKNRKPAPGLGGGPSGHVTGKGHPEHNVNGNSAQPLDLSAADVEALAIQLFGEPNRRLTTERALRFGLRGSLAVIPSRGVFTDHEAGVGGGVLAMIVHADAARSPAEAAAMLKAKGVIVAPQTVERRRQRESGDKARAARQMALAAALWREAGPISSTIGETYLRAARRIGLDVARLPLRFLSHAPIRPGDPDSPKAPAMVATIVNRYGEQIGAHLTYLRPDGLGKADVSPPRKMIGRAMGGHVRLGEGSRLIVGEGIESALSAWEASGGPARGLGCIAAMSAGGMAALEWPKDTTALVIAPDRDASGTGHRAARSLGARALACGLQVSFRPPPAGFVDWNDAAQAGRLGA